AVMLLAAVGGFTQFSNQTSFSSKASPEFIPRELVVHDLTETSFEISWVTTGMTVSAIEIVEQGADLDSKIIFMASEDESKIHQVIVDGLESQTTYEITIFSGDGWYGDGNEPIKITTE